MSPSRRRTSTGSWSSRHRKFRAREVEDVDPLLLDRQPRLPEGLAEPQVEAGEGEPGLQLVVGVARGDAVGVGVGLREEGEELGGDIGGGGVGGLGVGDAWSSGAVEEVHDALAADEDAEDLAGELVYDFETAAPGGAEVEEGVAEGEVEDVGMAGTPLKPSRLESHTGSPGASITRMESPAPLRRLPPIIQLRQERISSYSLLGPPPQFLERHVLGLFVDVGSGRAEPPEPANDFETFADSV